MSITLAAERLGPGIEATEAGIEMLQEALMARVRNSLEWTPKHLVECAELHADLSKMRLRLARLGAETT